MNQQQYYDGLYRAPAAHQRDGEVWAESQLLKWQLFEHVNQHYLGDAQQALEIGCGLGNFSRRLAATGLRVVGIDISSVAINGARESCADMSSPPTFVCGDISDYALPGGCDVAAAFDVLEHLDPDQAANLLGSIHDSLVPGGLFVFTTPNRLRLGNRARSMFGRPPSMYQAHEREYSYAELKASLAAASLQTLLVRGTHVVAPGYTIGCQWVHTLSRRVAQAGRKPSWLAAEFEWVCRRPE